MHPGTSHYFTKLSSSSIFLRSLMYSPIIFLSRRWFSLSHWATWLLSRGSLRRHFSWRNWMPFLGFWLNCSVPVISNWIQGEKIGNTAGENGYNNLFMSCDKKSPSNTFFFVLISISSCESGKYDEKRRGFFWALFSAERSFKSRSSLNRLDHKDLKRKKEKRSHDQGLTSITVSLILSAQSHLLGHQMSTCRWTYWQIFSLWRTQIISVAQSIKIWTEMESVNSTCQ